MNTRFKELRKELKLTQAEFAEKMGLSRSYINMIEMGTKTPAERTIKDICRMYNVNYKWLVNGIGEMFTENDSDAQAIVDSVMSGDNEFAKKILVKFARLSEERWKQIEEILNELELND